jgi:anti-sigma factor (TIGR02949 family)
LLTCKDFLNELNEYLDEAVGPDVRQKLQEHVNECPSCWVVVDTTRRTIQVYKGQEPQEIPSDIHDRLMGALHKKMAAGRVRV